VSPSKKSLPQSGNKVDSDTGCVDVDSDTGCVDVTSDS